jgi:hypothetical protein
VTFKRQSGSRLTPLDKNSPATVAGAAAVLFKAVRLSPYAFRVPSPCTWAAYGADTPPASSSVRLMPVRLRDITGAVSNDDAARLFLGYKILKP